MDIQGLTNPFIATRDLCLISAIRTLYLIFAIRTLYLILAIRTLYLNLLIGPTVGFGGLVSCVM